MAGGIYGAVQYDGTFHAVESGVVYRSAQLSGEKLDEVVRGYQIRSVLNLRGDNTGKPWYNEVRTVRADDVVHLGALRALARPAACRGRLAAVAALWAFPVARSGSVAMDRSLAAWVAAAPSAPAR